MTELMAAEPGSEEPPKRGRGRPRGSTNANRDPNAPRRGRKPAKRNLTEEIAQVLTLGNMALFGGEFAPGVGLPGVVPEGMALPSDPLTAVEIDALAKAINAVAQEQIVVYRYLDLLLSGTGGGSPYITLIIVCAAIAIPRIVDRGLLPPLAKTIAVGAGQFLGGMKPSNAAIPAG